MFPEPARLSAIEPDIAPARAEVFDTRIDLAAAKAVGVAVPAAMVNSQTSDMDKRPPA